MGGEKKSQKVTEVVQIMMRTSNKIVGKEIEKWD